MPWKFYTQPCWSCWWSTQVVSITRTMIQQVENAVYWQWFETIQLSNWRVKYRYNWWLYPYPPKINEEQTNKNESEESKAEEAKS